MLTYNTWALTSESSKEKCIKGHSRQIGEVSISFTQIKMLHLATCLKKFFYKRIEVLKWWQIFWSPHKLLLLLLKLNFLYTHRHKIPHTHENRRKLNVSLTYYFKKMELLTLPPTLSPFSHANTWRINFLFMSLLSKIDNYWKFHPSSSFRQGVIDERAFSVVVPD